MKNIGHRLLKVKILLGLDDFSFAKELGISRAYYQFVERGRNPVNVIMLENLIEKFHISTNWILTGRGNMFIDEKSPSVDIWIDQQGDRNIAVGTIGNLNIGKSEEKNVVNDESPIGLAESVKIRDLISEIAELGRRANIYPKSSRDDIEKKTKAKFRINNIADLPVFLYIDLVEYLELMRDDVIRKGLKSYRKTSFALMLNREIEEIRASLEWSDEKFMKWLEEKFGKKSIADLDEAELFESYQKIRKIGKKEEKP